MQWYFIVLIVLASLAILMLLPLFMSANLYLNIKENLGVVVLTLWGIPLICFQVRLQKTAITIIKRRGEEKQVPLKIYDPKVVFFEYFAKVIFRYIIIRNLSVFLTVAKKNDAFVSSLAGGVFLNTMYCFLAGIYTKKGEIPAYIGVNTQSDEDEFKVVFHTSVVLNLLIILAGAIRAKRLTKRWFKVYERFSRRNAKSYRATSGRRA